MKKIVSIMVSVVTIAFYAGGAASAEHTTSTDLMNTDMQQENIVEQKEKAREVIKKKNNTKKSYKKKGKPATASLNINTASKKELAALPGLGSTKAQAIIDSRPYNTKEDILKVKGIKKGTFEKFKDIITIQ